MTRYIKTLTDTNGDECALIYYDQPHQRTAPGLYVEASNPDGAVSAGPFTPIALRDALGEVAPAGSYARTDEQTSPTAEMVRRGHAALVAQTGRPESVAAFEAALTAALTEPPRPKGAEDVTEALFQAGAAVGVEMTPEKRAALADHLAAMGYRKADS